ncbi:unnamed protein product [Laminaria digitata]
MKGGPFADILKAAKRPMIIIGQGALTRADGDKVLAAARALADSVGAVSGEWNGFNVLHTAAARVGGLDLGFVPGAGGLDVNGILSAAAAGTIELVYLLGADEIDMAPLKKAFVVYQGHHGDAGAAIADVVLPGAAYTEKPGTYVNTEGRVQRAFRAAFPPGDAREDWAIIRAISDRLGKPLPYDNLEQLRERLVTVAPTFGAIDELKPNTWEDFGTPGDMDAQPFAPVVQDFYLTNSVSRASETMHACADSYAAAEPGTGTNG